jgi:hypothetical protein
VFKSSPIARQVWTSRACALSWSRSPRPPPWWSAITSTRAHDKEHYFNFTFGTRDLKALWETIRERLYGDQAFGEAIGRSSIATCEGVHGWDDYLLPSPL